MKRIPSDTDVYEYDALGDAAVIEHRTRPLRSPGPHEVVVEVITAGINHIEQFIRDGSESDWPDEPWPRGSGSDFAGIVAAAGAEVAGFRPGTEVIGHLRSGAHATYVTVPAGALVRKPPNVTWEVAGGLYLAGVTALDILDGLRIGEGDTVVVSAAAGGVGSIEVQLAKHLGARVIGTCGERNFDYLRQLGIIPVRYGDGIIERIRHVARGDVTAFIDNFGKDSSSIAEQLGVPSARFRSSEDRRQVELRLLQSDAESVAHGTSQLSRLADLAAHGAFRLLVSGHYALDDIRYAYEDLSHLHSRGKIILGTHPVTPFRTLRAREVHEAVS